MEVLETSVRLVVKAPNQQIDDQVVECTLAWTVQKLKTHLSEVYPNKPRSEEQKLIYSGQLLHDHLMLKDFLRQYDTEKVHTVHLVCLPSMDAAAKPSSSKARASDTVRMESGHQSTTHDPTFGDELRHRFTSTPLQPTNQFFDPALNTLTSPPTPMITNFGYPPMAADQLAQQMAWMQQVYGHYVHSYFQQLHGAMPTPEVPAREGVAGVPVSPPPPAIVMPANGPAVAVDAANPNENIRMNAQGGLVDDDDEEGAANGGRWDWLDWAYVLSRVTILFSIVYFYSSLSRFFMVAVIAVIMYLYQMGWINAGRARHRLQANPEVARPPEPEQPDLINDDDAVAAAAAAVLTGDAAESTDTEQMERETREIEELMNRGMENDDGATGNRVATLAVWMWTLVTTFFTSLLPETPAPANFN